MCWKIFKNNFENRISKDNDKKSNRGDKDNGLLQKVMLVNFKLITGINKRRPVMGMHGYGGQHVVIDFERSRIVVTNALHENLIMRK